MENKEIKYYQVTANRAEWKTSGYADNEYAKVYFRIRTPGFDCYSGSFDNQTDHDTFYQNVGNAFESIGWAADMCHLTNGKQHLYIHPQEISGVVKKNDIMHIAETLESLTHYINYVDIYNDVYDVTDEQYIEMINNKSPEIRQMILKAAVTKRTYMYIGVEGYNGIVEYIGRKVYYPRIGLTDSGVYTSGDTNELAYSVVRDCVNDLISEGKLFTMEKEGKLYVRTPNKTEQKKMKINLDI